MKLKASSDNLVEAKYISLYNFGCNGIICLIRVQSKILIMQYRSINFIKFITSIILKFTTFLLLRTY